MREFRVLLALQGFQETMEWQEQPALLVPLALAALQVFAAHGDGEGLLDLHLHIAVRPLRLLHFLGQRARRYPLLPVGRRKSSQSRLPLRHALLVDVAADEVAPEGPGHAGVTDHAATP